MVIWIDMVCLALALAPSCAALHFDASISCSQNPISPEDVIERPFFFLTPSMFNGEYGGFHHPAIYIAVTVSRRLSTQIQQEPTISLSKMTIPVSPKTLGTWRELGGSPSMLGAFSRDFLSYFDPMNGS